MSQPPSGAVAFGAGSGAVAFGPGSSVAPSEPAPSRWRLPSPEEMAPDSDLVGVGADLEPGTLLAAYRSGLFPMGLATHRGRRQRLGWFCPVERGVLPLDGLRVSRSLRQSTQRLHVTVDQCFERVVSACAAPRAGQSGDEGWITNDIAIAYTKLYELGWAHSVEVWDDSGAFAGGLYGVGIGGLFAGESMVTTVRDGSKVALVALVELLARDNVARLLDVQWSTPHLAGLGVVELPRAQYLARARDALALPAPDWAAEVQPSVGKA